MSAHHRKIAVIGLGYVGLPVAVAFGRSARTIGFDINAARVAELKSGHDSTLEVEDADLKASDIAFTCTASDLRAADFHIVAVPTPVDEAKRPDLTPMIKASETLGAHIKAGDIVVYESTVYPGATEEDCVPVLEQASGLVCGRDFRIGYSPERINPGDRQHRFETIVKVVAAQDEDTLELLARVYGSVVAAGVHRAPDIRTAEAAKAIENTQRDLNIALMNELAMICTRLGIDTRDVIDAAASKWNFLAFSPGLVGGHCVGVDPYYLTDRAERAGYHPEVILAGRRINHGMGRWIAQETVKRLYRTPGASASPTVTVLGITFKEDVPDVRNTRVVDLIDELGAFGVHVQAIDPLADAAEVAAAYGVRLLAAHELAPADGVVLAVPHEAFRRGGWPLLQGLLRDGGGLVVDVRACLSRSNVPPGIRLWRP